MLGESWLSDTPPVKLVALAARTAYGVAVSGCRGDRVVKSGKLELLVRTAISNQSSSPLSTPLPKSSATVNNPLLTATAEFVIEPLWFPPAGVSKTANR